MSDLTPDHPAQQQSDEEAIGLGFGLTVFERFLLAIINGNPTETDKTARQRLDGAMKLLIGEKASPNPLPDSRDNRALIFMGQELHCDKCNRDMHLIKHHRNPCPPPAPKVRSDLALAELAADQFFQHSNEEVRHSTALLRKSGGDSCCESSVVAGWHEQTDIADLQDHELGCV